MRRPRPSRNPALCILAAAMIGCAGGRDSIGFIAGDPTGLSMSWALDGKADVVLGLGLGFFRWDLGRGHVDWVRHKSGVRGGEWVPYWGAGARFLLADDVAHVGPRVPLGVTYDFGDETPYFFAELAPGVDLTGGGLVLDWGVGLRFAF